MSRRSVGFFAALLCWLSFGLPSNAQTNANLETGLKPYGSYEGGNIDSISLANGNLTIHIPLFSYPQRGSIPANMNLSYNNKNWYVFQWCQNAICHDQWRWNLRTNHGIFFNVDGGVGVGYATSIPGAPSVYLYTAYTSDGSSHQMAPDNAGGYRTSDGTGIWYAGGNGLNGLPFTIRTSDGSQPLSVDPNGNLATSSSPNQNYPSAFIGTDTLGRNLSPPGTATTDYSGCVQPAAPNQINAASISSYPGQNGTNRQVKVCSASYTLNTNFQQYDGNAGTAVLEGTETASFIVSVVLYNGSSWSTSPAWGFDYVSRDMGDASTINYGDLTKITLPTGGIISYKWGTTQLCIDPSAVTQVSRTVTSKAVDAQNGSGSQTWGYAIGNGPTIVTGPAPGNDQTVHVMGGFGTCGLYEVQTKYFQGPSTTGTLLKTVNIDYISSPNPYATLDLPNVNVLPIRTTTIWPNGKTTKTEKDYDSNFHSGTYNYSYGQVLAVREYDYGTTANTPGPLLQTTTNSYLAATNTSYLAANLIHLISSTTIKDGSGTQVAQTTFAYDGAGVQASGVTNQHDNAKASSPRGNRTSTCRWLNATGASICTTTKFYDTGMPYQVTDPVGNSTTFSYSSTYAGAYVTQSNLPDTNAPNLAHHVIGGGYDFNTGQLTSFTDQNNQASSYSYDLLGRVTAANFPDGGLTTFAYNDVPLSANVERQEKIVGSTMNVFRVYFDGLARKKQIQLRSDPAGIVYTDFTYDNLGRLFTQTNPYRLTSDATYGITTHNYDALNRETLVIPPDGSSSTNNVQTQYCAGSTLVTDQSGHWRRSTGDGLGRLIEVDEPNSAVATVNVCPGTGEPVWVTVYSYDALSNLKTVVQNGSRNRSFIYDSLSRMTSSTNPEAGTVTYSYDSIGNVQKKTDARGVSGIFGYDALNRLVAKRFTDSTATVYYLFDGALPASAASTSGAGTVTITGAEQSIIPDCIPSPTCQTIYDTGTVSISVGGFAKTVTYQKGSTKTSIASALATAFNSDLASPVGASASTGTITFTARLSGVLTNYPFSTAVTFDEGNFYPASFGTNPVASALTGGNGTCTGTGITLTVANGIGRRSGMCDAGGAEAWSFDVMGRELTDQRTTGGITKSTSYTYNPNGSAATLTYPTGRTITYAPNAASQPVSAIDVTNSINYATAASYAPQGALASLTLGSTGSFAGVQINGSYNARLQPTEIKAWSTAGVAMDLLYSFVDTNSKNNGNVTQVTNSKDTARSQQFTYDQLNRILTAKTTATSGANCWSYSYGIDVWANLNSAQPISGYSCTQSNLSLSISTNNRITNTGLSYDVSGNTLTDGLNTYTWDAESQIKFAAGVTYIYDGDGNRVQKSNGKLYWYGAGSEVLDESDASGNITDEYVFFGGKRVAHRVVSSGSVYYYAEDFIGSSRVITAATGAVCYEADFLPFGGERTITNTCPQNYKFTGKERDAETGNDNFGARYFSSSLGRWLSPDWSAIPAPVPYATLTNPQTLNLYQYVGNNPETFADIDGHLWPIGVQDPPIGHTSQEETAEAVICSLVGDSCTSASDKQEKEAKAKTEEAQRPPQNQTTPQSLAAQVPPEAKAAIMNALNASNAPTADDKKGGFHEESVKWGTDSSGNVVVSPSVPGAYAPPGTNPHTDFTPANPATDQKLATVGGFAHIHPKGGGDRSFVQGPSGADLKFAGMSSGPINLVVGAADKKVYFYNGSGVIGKPMKLKDFMGDQ